MGKFQNIFVVLIAVVALVIISTPAKAAQDYWNNDTRYPFICSASLADVYLDTESIDILSVPKEEQQPLIFRESILSVDKKTGQIYERPSFRFKIYPHKGDMFYDPGDGDGYVQITEQSLSDGDEYEVIVYLSLLKGLELLAQ